MKFPSADETIGCTNTACGNANNALLPEDRYARLRMDHDGTIAVDAICPTCAGAATKRGIPAPKIADLIAANWRNRELADQDVAELEAFDKESKAVNALFADAVFACGMPGGCTGTPEPASKMRAVIYRGDGNEQIVPICSRDAETAKSTGARIGELHVLFARRLEVARNGLLYMQEQRRENRIARMTVEFFDKCVKADKQTARAHQGNGHQSNGAGFNQARVGARR
jgi:hypothetical protein